MKTLFIAFISDTRTLISVDSEDALILQRKLISQGFIIEQISDFDYDSVLIY